MTPQQEKTMFDLLDEFKAWGYFVFTTPIAGEEADYLRHLYDGIQIIRKRITYNARRYGLRGRSQRAIAYLNSDIPNPVWGVEVRD